MWGKSQKEHDTHLEALMKCLSENNLTLNNASKCKFNVDSIRFYGYTLRFIHNLATINKHLFEELLLRSFKPDMKCLNLRLLF